MIFEWLASNSLRRYPLVADQAPLLTAASGTGGTGGGTNGPGGGGPASVLLPDSAIVDYRACGGPRAYDVGTTRLVSARRSGGSVTFTFAADGDLTPYRLAFTVAIAAPEFTLTVDRGTLAGVAIGLGCVDDPPWEGTLITGDLTPLAALLADGVTYSASPGIAVEPACTVTLAGRSVRSLGLANRTRLRVTPAAGCAGSGLVPATRGYVAVATCIEGDPRLVAGFNCLLGEDPTAEAIAIGAAAGAGAGPACGEVAPPGEATPAGSSLYSGGPRCDDVVAALNGASARFLAIEPGPGVKVIPDPDDPHGVLIDFTPSDPSRGC